MGQSRGQLSRFIEEAMKADTPFKVRPASPADGAAIVAVLRDIEWLVHIKGASDEVVQRIARHIERCNADESHAVLVAEDSVGAVVGYVAVHWLPYLILPGCEGYVSELFVRGADRGKGVGKTLLEAVRECGLARGCYRLHLVTGRGRDSYQVYRRLRWKERPDIADLILPLRPE